MCKADKPPKPSESTASPTKPAPTVELCPIPPKPNKPTYTLVELVEVVQQAALGVVQGAGAASGKLATIVTRTDKNGGAYKQFINIDKDVEGAPKRHPEHGRYIEVRARIEGTGPLAGQTVQFSHTLTGGKDRPAGMTGGVKEGWGSAGGADTTTGSTDAEGWTGTVSFYVSQYAGDQFSLAAQLLGDDGKPTGAKKTIATYEVWRKFWYQVTRATTHVVPAPAKSVTAYETVLANMFASTEVTFDKVGTPAGTFYPGWMLRTGGADADESVIGGHNRDSFYPKFVDEPAKPVKGHLIICQHQWDPGPAESALHTSVVTSNPSQELTIDLGAWNAGIVKPALQGTLVTLGEWSGGGKTGPLTDADILVQKGRADLNVVKVQLPADAPDPTKVAVTVKLKVNYGKYYAGESNKHHMLIAYRGDDAQLMQVVSHEFGHGFGQTPRPGAAVAPLANHAKQYDNAYGGQGSHCATDSTEVVDASTTSGKRKKDGTCIMFHQVNPSGCKQLFCAVCEPHLKLQDMSSMK